MILAQSSAHDEWRQTVYSATLGTGLWPWMTNNTRIDEFFNEDYERYDIQNRSRPQGGKVGPSPWAPRLHGTCTWGQQSINDWAMEMMATRGGLYGSQSTRHTLKSPKIVWRVDRRVKRRCDELTVWRLDRVTSWPCILTIVWIIFAANFRALFPYKVLGNFP